MFPQNVGMTTGRQRAGLAAEARRGDLGMNREEFAAAARVDPKTVWSLEKGLRWPIATTRARIESALGWPSGELETRARAPKPEPELDDDEEMLAALRAAYRRDPQGLREAVSALRWAGELPPGEPAEAESPPGQAERRPRRAG